MQLHVFSTSAIAGGEWPASFPTHFTPRERVPGTQWLRGWVGPRTSLDDLEKLELEHRLLSRPSSQKSKLFQTRCTKLYRKSSKNHLNPNICATGQGEAMYRNIRGVNLALVRPLTIEVTNC
jgi:hypothetical protein